MSAMDTTGPLWPASDTSPSQPRGRRAVLLLLTLIVVAGLLVRVVGLGRESLWWDEGASLRLARMPVGAMMRALAADDFSPPLYYLLLHGWIGVFGESDAAMRLLSALFGAAAVGVMYLLGARLLNRAGALMAAALVALAPFQVAYSQEARGYSLMMLLGLGAMYYFVRLLEEPSRAAVAGYWLCSLLLIYTHVCGLFIVATQAACYLALWWARRPRAGIGPMPWIGLHVGLALAYAPSLWLIAARAGDMDGFWIAPAGVGAMKVSLIQFAGAPLMLGLFALLSGVGVLTAFWPGGAARGRLGVTAVALPVVWLVGPMVLCFIASRVGRPIYVTRYLIPASAGLYLMAAGGVAWLAVRPAVGALVGLLAAGISAHALYAYQTTTHGEPWRQLAQYVEEHAQPGDLVLFNAELALDPLFAHYATRRDLKCQVVAGDVEEVTPANVDEVLRETEGHGRIWLVLCRSVDPNGLMAADLARRYQVTSPGSFDGSRGPRLFFFQAAVAGEH